MIANGDKAQIFQISKLQRQPVPVSCNAKRLFASRQRLRTRRYKSFMTQMGTVFELSRIAFQALLGQALQICLPQALVIGAKVV